MKTITSIKISQITGKRHCHILADIRTLIKQLNLNLPDIWGKYKDKSGKENIQAILPYEVGIALMAKYNVNLQYSLVNNVFEEKELYNFGKGVEIKFIDQKLLGGPIKQNKTEVPIAKWVQSFEKIIGEKELYNVLCKNNILYKTKTYQPYQKYIDNGFFRMVFKNKKLKEQFINFKEIYITLKGIKHFTKKQIRKLEKK